MINKANSRSRKNTEIFAAQILRSGKNSCTMFRLQLFINI